MNDLKKVTELQVVSSTEQCREITGMQKSDI